MIHSDFLPASRPLLHDLRSCEDWLARTTLASPDQACASFAELLDELEDAPPRHAAYMAILERLRVPMGSALSEQARRFAGKALPLGHAEQAAFERACSLWQSQQRAWRRLLRASLNGRHPELAPSAALLAQRALEASAELVATRLSARQQVLAEHWYPLHEIYALAETRGLHRTPVPLLAQATRPGNAANMPTATGESMWLQAVLLSIAGTPGMPAREFAWTRRWLRRFAARAAVVAEAPPGAAFCVDVGLDRGASWVEHGMAAGAWGEGSRAIDAAELLRALKRRGRRLREGADPEELGLGRDCIQPAATELLAALVRAWTSPPAAREFPRHASSTPVEVAGGFDNIHRCVGGELPEAGDKPWQYTRRNADQLHVFQRALDDGGKPLEAPAHQLESWFAQDESALGFRLMRDTGGQRVAHRQLLALRPRGASRHILAEVRWLTQHADGRLVAGARALPGMALPCAVRAAPRPGAKEAPAGGWTAAFMLQVATGVAPALVLPAGWYQADRQLELMLDGTRLPIRLFGVLSRGFDFDRVQFSPE